MAAVEKEFRTGWELQRHMTEQREKKRSSTPHATSGAVDGLGHISSSIPVESYFYWLNRGREKMGVANIWGESEFRRDYLRDNPQARVKYQRQNAMTGWTNRIVLAGKYDNLKPHKEASAA